MTLKEFGLDEKLIQKRRRLWIITVVKTCAMIFDRSLTEEEGHSTV